MNRKEIKTFHLIAVCGTGMASLAGLLQAAGHRVQGSDANIYPPMSTLLERLGIPVLPGYLREHLSAEIDQVVVGNAVSRDNPEVEAMQALGLPYASFPETLSRYFLEDRRSLVVAGTHGKTSTTGLLAWTLTHAGRDPGFMVGGWLKNFDSNHRYGRGDCFVVEGDEYDTAFFDKGPKFLHYRPHAAILTGIEFDHADIFRDLDHLKSAFRRFVEQVDPSGFLLVDFSDQNAKDVLQSPPCPVETYGPSAEADWQVADYRREGDLSRFRLLHRGVEAGRFALPMIGRHNTLNAGAVAALCLKLGLRPEEIDAAFREFQGIKRRQEVVGEAAGVTVIDDFAHHPTAIDLTLAAVREAWPGRRLWAVFEPRSATARRRVFQERLPASFRNADETLIAGLFAPEKIPPEQRLDPEQVVQEITRAGGSARFLPGVQEIVDCIVRERRPGDVVLVMSSGGFGGIHRRLLERLEQSEAA